MNKPQSIIVCSRWRVPSVDMDVPYAVISITDPNDEHPKIPQRRGLREILRLKFHDLEPSLTDVGQESDRNALYQFMSADDAQRVRRFIEDSDANALVIHCEAGVSRSPSCAMALCDQLKWGRDCIRWAGGNRHKDPPNQHVYSTTRSAWSMPSVVK